MSIKHVDTELKGDRKTAAIRMRFADAVVAEEAREFFELNIPFDNLPGGVVPPTQDSSPDAKLQIAALRYVRDALSAEILRLSQTETG